MGGRVKGNFGGAQVFSPLAYQNPISPIWRENLGDFISTQSIKFLSLFLLHWTWKSQVPLAFDYASTNLIIFSYFLVNIVHHFFFSQFFFNFFFFLLFLAHLFVFFIFLYSYFFYSLFVHFVVSGFFFFSFSFSPVLDPASAF